MIKFIEWYVLIWILKNIIGRLSSNHSTNLINQQPFNGIAQLNIFRQNNNEENFDNNDDQISNASTNLSLFSLYSIQYEDKTKYGKIGHFSPFERFTNRGCRKSLKDNISLIATLLKHYSQ